MLFRVLVLSTLVCRFDPLGLMDPEGQGGFINQAWLKYSEVIHARWAMLGAAGALIAQHQLLAMLGSSSGLVRSR